MNKILLICLIALMILPNSIYANKVDTLNVDIPTNETTFSFEAIRQDVGCAIIVPDTNPFFAIIGASLACWYDDTNTSNLLPLLIQSGNHLSEHQKIFLDRYLKTKNDTILVLGEHLDDANNTTEILGSPPKVALDVATRAFVQSSTILVLPYNTDNAYKLSLIASPLASYCNIPILLYDDNLEDIQHACIELNSTSVFTVGSINLTLSNITIIPLKDEEAIQNEILSIIKDQFNGINYITLTNPSDIIAPETISFNETILRDHIENTKVTFLGKAIDIKGNDTKQYKVYIPDGVNKIQIHSFINKTNKVITNKIGLICPVIYMSLSDPFGNIVIYGSSFGYGIGETYGETVVCNLSGNYTLTITVYNGVKGGFFSLRGLSRVNADIETVFNVSKLESMHLPFIPKLSMTAPYLTAAHGGIIVADSNFELTDDNYSKIAKGYAAGPWYNEELQEYNNEKVNYTLEKLRHSLSLIDDHQMLTKYLNGSAWLAILGGTNMIPMYYYGPSQDGLHEKGLPSDNPYSLDWNLSVGRVVSYNVQDVSLLISRTLFYKEICDQPKKIRDWRNRFSFVFGEGFGETGGLFHQIPYSLTVKKYGFKSRIYGDFKNSRQLTTLFRTYTNANYIEYLGHGDWFWFSPSLYGFDYLNKAVDVAHAKDWIYNGPSVFLTSACLMGRIDGIPPYMNIGLTMIHAGCNAFVGATRETGQEAGLTTLENHLIVDNFSVGEALRGEKRIDKEPATYYVRVLYGDPAFNPYEPNNGFSDQGRPTQV